MNKNILKLFLVLTIMIPLAIAFTEANTSNRTPIIYTSDVDQDYGFYKIRALNSNQSISYENKTLNISVGDTIIWINDAKPDEVLTIISDQNLWGNDSARLRWNYQKFNYTFMQPGVYSFHVKEYSRLDSQIIIVGALTTPTPYIPTPNTRIFILTPTTTLTEKKVKMVPTSNQTPGFTIFIGSVAILYVIIIKKL